MVAPQEQPKVFQLLILPLVAWAPKMEVKQKSWVKNEGKQDK